MTLNKLISKLLLLKKTVPGHLPVELLSVHNNAGSDLSDIRIGKNIVVCTGQTKQSSPPRCIFIAENSTIEWLSIEDVKFNN